ncbi:hypothetical protein [Rubrivirga sp.]|uniref:hypothetical protein n=1 Tax=Rubrivirga sp. TaxID=1885344 RepID=UPI003B516365
MTSKLCTSLLVLGTLAMMACDTTAPLVDAHSVIGSGYADFDDDGQGGAGDNLYFVDATVDSDGQTAGTWRADVFIDYGGGTVFDFEALYSVDCLEVDATTKEAWVEGVVFEANDPEFLGRRAFLYVRDGDPGGDDLHAITPFRDDAVTCADRPAPDFMETVESGDYSVE